MHGQKERKAERSEGVKEGRREEHGSCYIEWKEGEWSVKVMKQYKHL